MIKKVLGFLLASTLVVSLAPITLAACHFPDVSETWCEPYVSSLVEKKIVNGMEDGKYHPNDQVTRGAVAKLLMTAMQYCGSSITTSTKNNPLPDTAGKWSEQYIVPLCRAGIISSSQYERGFVENQAMSRLETIKTIVRTYLHAHPDVILPFDATLTFTDKAQISEFDVPYVALGVDLGIINGIPVDGGVAFKPNDGILRSEASAMMSRFLDKCGKFSDHLGTSEIRVDGSVPTASQVSNLPQIKASNGKIIEWVLAPTIQMLKQPLPISNFSEDGLCSYVAGTGRQVFVDQNGNTYSFPLFGNWKIGDFVQGLAPARDPQSCKWGYIDMNGKFAIAPKYDSVEPFSLCYFKDGTKGYWAEVDRYWNANYVNPKGTLMSGAEFDAKVDWVKTRGKMTAPKISELGCKVEEDHHTSDGLFVIVKTITDEQGKVRVRYGIVDSQGKTLLAPTSNRYGSARAYDDCIILSCSLSENYWDVLQKDIYDSRGKLVTTVYDGTEVALNEHSPYRSFCYADYGQGLFAATDYPEGKHGFMKLDGSFFIPCVFDDAKPFNQDLAWVQYNGLWGLIKMPSR